MILIQLILLAFFVGIFLFIFSSSFRNWLFLKLVERVGRKMQDQAGGFGQNRGRREQEPSEDDTPHHHDKIPLDDIEARRFQKGQNDEYVDFEELP